MVDTTGEATGAEHVGDMDSLARLRTLFDHAIELSGPERTAWLAAEVGDVRERAALQRLLDADVTEKAILDVPIADVATALMSDMPDVAGLVGQRVGAFRLTRLLGKGGMAAVFLGERDDGQFHQRVAIKLLRRGLFSELEQRLFARERQVLAQLTHPNIARLFDGGVTSAGIPYLVIEYVDGVVITDYANENGLGIAERLRLFLIVCDAVEAAHRAMVVHRDIKPANILVRKDGAVKLLDFGVAKLLDDDVANATSSAFTPEYAAPEQLDAGPITTATDVFGLGVLLYELLVGARPNRERVHRPSSVAQRTSNDRHAAVIARSLRGDLDNVILKALATDPVQRYATATAFATDLRHHLAGRAVSAHPPSRWYRTRKFVARHRGSVAGACAFTLAIAAAFALTAWEANVAHGEAHRANAVRDFVESIFDPLSMGTVADKQPSYATLLATSVQRLDAADHVGDEERVDLLLLFARLNEKIGEYDKALALADRASEYADRTLGMMHPLSVQASVDGGLIAEHHGLVDKAALRLAAAEQRYLKADIGGMALIRLYDGLSALADDRGDAKGSLHYAQLSFSERASVFSPEDDKLAVGYNNLAFAFEALGDFEHAAESYRHAVAIHEKQLGVDSFETAIPLSSLGSVEALGGHLRDGVRDLERANRIFALATGKPRGAYAANAGQLCTIETFAAMPDADRYCRDALTTAEAVYGKQNPSYALAELVDGRRDMIKGDYAGAHERIEAAEKLLSASNTASWLGRAKISEGELAQLEHHDATAIDTLTQGIDEFGAGYPPTLRVEAEAIEALACSAAACATDTYRQAKSDLAAAGYIHNAMLLPAHVALARVEMKSGAAADAVIRLRTSITSADSEVEPTSALLAEALLWLAAAEDLTNDCTHASSDLRRARAAIDAGAGIANARFRDALRSLRSTQACSLDVPARDSKEQADRISGS